MKRPLFVASVTFATLFCASAFSAVQDTYPGTMCNGILNNVTPNGGVEIVNSAGTAVLVMCPFRKDAQYGGPVYANTTQRLAFRGANTSSVSCSLRATMPNGSGWNWGAYGVTIFSGYYEAYWSGNYSTGSNKQYGAALECVMQPGAVISNYRVWEN